MWNLNGSGVKSWKLVRYSDFYYVVYGRQVIRKNNIQRRGSFWEFVNGRFARSTNHVVFSGYEI